MAHTRKLLIAKMSANNLLKTTEREMQWPNYNKLIASQLLIFTIPVLEI